MPEHLTPVHPASLPADTLLVRGRTRLGEMELIFASDGTFLLDGGAMFGVVPKPLWQQQMPADAANRIQLGLNTIIVKTGSAVVLIETGVGSQQGEKSRRILENQALLLSSLDAAGLRPEDVTHVVNSHLHFDHCGWNTTLGSDGAIRPTFPQARYIAHRGEVEHGRLQLERDRVSYQAPNYEPLIESGQMILVDSSSLRSDPQIVPGVWLEEFPGHTGHMMAVHLESGGRHACFLSDLFPTTHHLNLSWVTGYDLDPVRTIAERKRLLARAIPEQWLVLFPHDHQIPAATLRHDQQGRPVAEPAFPDLLEPRTDLAAASA